MSCLFMLLIEYGKKKKEVILIIVVACITGAAFGLSISVFLDINMSLYFYQNIQYQA